jgi:hypothetical protein
VASKFWGENWRKDKKCCEDNRQETTSDGLEQWFE